MSPSQSIQDFSNDRVVKFEMRKIPYMLIVGEKEEETDTVSVRKHGEGDLGTFKVEEIIQLILNEVNEITKFN